PRRAGIAGAGARPGIGGSSRLPWRRALRIPARADRGIPYRPASSGTLLPQFRSHPLEQNLRLPARPGSRPAGPHLGPRGVLAARARGRAGRLSVPGRHSRRARGVKGRLLRVRRGLPLSPRALVVGGLRAGVGPRPGRKSGRGGLIGMAAARWDNLVYSAAVVLPRLAAFLLLPAIASVLSVSDMGKLATSWIFIELFQTLAGLGLKAALGRFFPRATEPARRREILTISLCGNLAGGLVLGLATWAAFALPFSRTRIHFFDSIDYPVFAALLGTSVLGNLASTFIIYFRAEQRAWAFLAASVIGAGIEACLAVGLLAAERLSLLNLLLIECLKQAAMLAFIAYQGRKDWGFAFSRQTLKTMAAFGIWLVPVGLGEWFVNSSDRFWLGQQGDLDLVGVYGFLYKFAMPLGILFT